MSTCDLLAHYVSTNYSNQITWDLSLLLKLISDQIACEAGFFFETTCAHQCNHVFGAGDRRCIGHFDAWRILAWHNGSGVDCLALRE